MGNSQFVYNEQQGGFQPFREYDALAVALQQLLSGPTAEGIKNIVLNPGKLSPTERRRFMQSMIDSAEAGGGGPAAAAAAMVTNPWVWLMVGTSAFGMSTMGSFLKGTTKSMFSVAKKYSALSKPEERGFVVSLLHSLGLSSDLQVVAGTPAGTAAMEVAGTIRRSHEGVRAAVQGAEQAVMERVSKAVGRQVTTLEWQKETGMARTLLRKIDTSMQIRNLGLDSLEGYEKTAKIGNLSYREQYFDQATRQWLEKPAEIVDFDGKVRTIDSLQTNEQRVLAFRELSDNLRRQELAGQNPQRRVFESTLDPEGNPAVIVEEKRIRPYGVQKLMDKDKQLPQMADPSLVDEVIEGFGLRPLMEARKKAARDMYVKLAGDEKHYTETGLFKTDLVKITKLWNEMRKGGLKTPTNPDHIEIMGEDLLELIFGLDGVGKFKRVEHSPEAMAIHFDEVLGKGFNKGEWRPLNVPDLSPVAGVKFDPDTLRGVHQTPGQMRGTGRIIPPNVDQPMFSPEDMDFIYENFGKREAARFHAQEVRNKAADVMMQHHKGLVVQRVSHNTSFDRYIDETVRSHAYYTAPVSRSLLEEQAEMLRYVDPEKANVLAFDPPTSNTLQGKERPPKSEWTSDPRGRGGEGLKYSEAWKDQPAEKLPGAAIFPEDAFSPAMVMRYVHELIPDEGTRGALRTMVDDGVLGRVPREHLVTKVMFQHAQRGARAVADGFIGKWMEETGPWGKTFVQKLRDFGNPEKEIPSVLSGGSSSALAKYLYVTHLGVNPGSVVLNLFQPLLLVGPTLGFGAMAKGYMEAAKEMFSYASERIQKYGVKPITDGQRAELIARNFRYAGKETGGINVIGISGDTFNNVDAFMLADRYSKRKGVAELALFEYPMKMFEKSEWFVRNVAAHSVAGAYQKAGRSLVGGHFLQDMERFVAETQYASSPLNTPRVLKYNKLLGNPLVRQFLTFPLRSAIQGLAFTPIMGERQWAQGVATTFLRGMGASAVMYEAGKHLLGADLSRAGYWSATTDILGADRVTDTREDFLPLPPFIDIPVGLVRGLAGDDLDLMKESLLRLVPGGIMAGKVLSAMPQMPSPLSMFQRSSIDWANPLPDGSVAMFSGDGSLVEYKKPSDVIYRALGVDFGRMNDTAELDAYLLKQREEIVRYRQKLLMALGANDQLGAQAVRAEFSKRFKDPRTGQPLPLTVNERQLRDYLNRLRQPRTERILDMMPPEQRAMYGREVMGSGRFHGNSPSSLEEGTAAQRPRTGQGPSSAQTIERMLREGSIPGAQRELRESPFGEGFSSFSPF